MSVSLSFAIPQEWSLAFPALSALSTVRLLILVHQSPIPLALFHPTLRPLMQFRHMPPITLRQPAVRSVPLVEHGETVRRDSFYKSVAIQTDVLALMQLHKRRCETSVYTIKFCIRQRPRQQPRFHS